MERDEDVRAACFAALDVLQAKWGPDLPYATLAEGFNFRGRKVPFPNRGFGIYRAADVQRGAAALSLNSSFAQKRYKDVGTDEGILYRYQDGPIGNHFNTWLRTAYVLRVPLVYFIGTRKNWYRPEYPAFVERDFPEERSILLTFGRMRGPYDEREPVHIDDASERRYVVRQVKQRVHQAQFRGAVLLAYRDQCSICRLKEVSLLDAAHIDPDAEPTGATAVPNGLSMCMLHHRAFDRDLVGISPDYEVHLSRRLLDDEDGPMLDLLKGSHGAPMELPARRTWYPDRERLAARFDRFRAVA